MCKTDLPLVQPYDGAEASLNSDDEVDQAEIGDNSSSSGSGGVSAVSGQPLPHIVPSSVAN